MLKTISLHWERIMCAKTPYKQDKYLFFILFAALNLVFAFYQIVFFWGNHDWDWIKGTTQVLSLNTGMFEGRYAKFILNVLLFGGQIFPLLNTLTSFALLSLGGVLLVRYWQISDKTTGRITALLALLLPNILGWLYFPINILGNFAAVWLAVSGLLLSEQKNIQAQSAAVICFLLALGVYPSTAEMIIVCFCFKYIINPPQRLKKTVLSAGCIVFSLLLFKLLLAFLGFKGWIDGSYYNLQTITISEIWQHLPETLNTAVGQFYLDSPFFLPALKFCGLILVIAAFIKTARQSLLFWAAAGTATVLSTLLTASPEETAYMPRVNFYGMNFFYAGAVAVLLCRRGYLRNLGLVGGILLLWQGINADLYAQKVWYLGKTAEENLVNRISARIEEHPLNIPLTPIVAGELSLRPRYYLETYRKESPYLLNRSFMVRHIPSGMFNFYAPETLFNGVSLISDLTPELYRFIKTAAHAWPAQTSLYLDPKYVLIMLTPEGIKAIQAQLP